MSFFEDIMQHMGECKIHDVLYVEVNPTKPEGCPLCSGRLIPDHSPQTEDTE